MIIILGRLVRYSGAGIHAQCRCSSGWACDAVAPWLMGLLVAVAVPAPPSLSSTTNGAGWSAVRLFDVVLEPTHSRRFEGRRGAGEEDPGHKTGELAEGSELCNDGDGLDSLLLFLIACLLLPIPSQLLFPFPLPSTAHLGRSSPPFPFYTSLSSRGHAHTPFLLNPTKHPRYPPKFQPK
ncbi:hypothetical protein FA13DRAFT_519065 [Coprinellus micaceus]|uniref:Uncharacterized protein n=1 Tax=Coprinellus micaceus TaxID=71717 RepID=A0A4Y7T8V0_COPMI|nr:hypothetical protein FA13DRAFT_519065 [Coprinellus micaceus]